MTYPGSGHRIDARKAALYGDGLPLAPYSGRLIFANYADREILLTDPARKAYAWGDVVGARDFVQADTSKQPAESLFTTKDAISFDGVNDFMASPSVDLTAYTAITIAMTFQFTGGTTKIIYETSTGNVAGNWRVMETNATTFEVRFRNIATDSLVSVTGLTAGNAYRLIFVLNANSGTTISRCYVNNVSQGTGGTSDRGFANSVHYIGMRAGTSLPWGGKLGDMLVYGDALSVAEIGIVDAFLASRAT